MSFEVNIISKINTNIYFSEQENCAIRGLKIYLKHSCWQQALDLLSNYTKNGPLHVNMFHLALAVFTKVHLVNMVSQYVLSQP